MRRIGSSDAYAVLAFFRPELVSKRRNAADVWLRIVHGIETPRTPGMTRGLLVEPRLRERFRHVYGHCTEPLPFPDNSVQHPDCEWATASPDGLHDSEKLHAVVELKTASTWDMHRWGPAGSDLVPDDYGIQCAQLMACTNRDVTLVYAAFGVDGKDESGEPTFTVEEYRPFELLRNRVLEDELLRLEGEFWESYCVTGEPPPLAPVSNRRAWRERVGDAFARECGAFGGVK